MLTQIDIRQFILIEELRLDLKNKLTVLTGETGAGKSILLDALGLIIGDKADADLIRSGAEQTSVTAIFEPPKTSMVWPILTAHEVAKADELIIRRIITRDGKNKILLNDQPVTLQLLKELGPHLVEIHGQFANHELLQSHKQRQLMDLFGGYGDLVTGTHAAWAAMRAAEEELETEKQRVALEMRDRDFLSHAVRELRALSPKAGEYGELQERRKKLQQTNRIRALLQDLQSQLVAGSGAERALSQANRILERQTTMDGDVLAAITEHLALALQHTSEATRELVRLIPQYELYPGSLEELEERLFAFKEIARKHQHEPENLAELFEQLSHRLNRIETATSRIQELQGNVVQTKRAYMDVAEKLSAARKEAALRLGAGIKAELPPLKLAQADFVVDVARLPDAQFGPHGLDEVNFTARTNPGSPFTPIGKTASGGELARMMLALKVILQRVQGVTTLIFDEVDTGIGGATAAAVGERLAMLADETQVLVVTHSPQVAARGQQHFTVSKQTDGQVTTSSVRALSVGERIDEIARMLSGDHITKAARDAAKSLLEESDAAAITRAERREAAALMAQKSAEEYIEKRGAAAG
ncbi:MAG: DNA repair protein RecN [Alphaproteobacteria bacterium]|nr:DNA repair protein RecN [Alphaproteobacteria bacterium]NDC55923.1 DNA repair protein RecN [Alphaproteobacteria bacterium]NDG04113.1 DNA repair protein RecN [Alphaproteobacteria bacterium]